jgi:hypothetical protein
MYNEKEEKKLLKKSDDKKISDELKKMYSIENIIDYKLSDRAFVQAENAFEINDYVV